MSYSLRDLMQLLIREHGEAVHLHPGEAPVLEINRVLHRVEGPSLGHADTEALLQTVAKEDDLLEFRSSRMVCFYHRLDDATLWAVEQRRTTNDVPTWEAIAP